MKINWQMLPPRMLRGFWMEEDWIHYIIANEMIENWIIEYGDESMDRNVDVGNMKKCPDCGKEFDVPKKEGEYCDPTEMDCASIVIKLDDGTLVWWNENWG